MGKGILFLHLNLLFKQYLLAVLFFILYKVVLTFETEVKILKCDNENCGMVLFCGARNYLAPSYTYYVQGNADQLCSSFLWCCFLLNILQQECEIFPV